MALPAASQTSKTYIVAFDHVFQSLKPVHSIALPGVSSGSVATEVALPTDTEVATSLIYLGDPSQVTIDDLALVIGYGQVPVEQRTPEAIVDLLDRWYISTPSSLPFSLIHDAMGWDPLGASSLKN